MKLIPLTQGKFAKVDDADFDWLNQWKWCAHKGSKTYYAVRGVQVCGTTKLVRMHAIILPGVKRVDHEDEDGLNNQRHNLRKASHAQNLANRGPQANNTSGFKGVYWNRRAHRWQAQITVAGKIEYLGLFDDVTEAAAAYDRRARELLGPFAWTNL